METSGRSIVLFVLYAVMHVQVAKSCSCSWTLPNVTYCLTDYAYQARVLSETSSLPEESDAPEGVSTTVDSTNKHVTYTYEVELETVYRRLDQYDGPHRIRTIVSEGLNYCVQRLVTGHSYFLMGYNFGSNLGLSCSGTFDLTNEGNRDTVKRLTDNLPQCHQDQDRGVANARQASSLWRRILLKN